MNAAPELFSILSTLTHLLARSDDGGDRSVASKSKINLLSQFERRGHELLRASLREQSYEQTLKKQEERNRITVLRPSGREVPYTCKPLSRSIGSPRR